MFLLVAAAGILLLVLMNFKNRAQSHSERAAGPHLRVQGVLKPRTLRRRDDACEYRFTLTSQEGPGTARELEVRLLRCTVPDNLRDVPGEPTEVIAEGKLVAAGHFEASQLMVRNAWKFEMNERAARGERAPHAVPASP